MSATLVSLVRRTCLPAAAGLLLLGLASPAGAAVPEGWSDPEPVSALHVVLLLVAVPVLLFVGITTLVYVPSLLRAQRAASAAETQPREELWIGAQRSAGELAGPGNESETGGASGRW